MKTYMGYGPFIEDANQGAGYDLFVVAKYSNNDDHIGHLADAHPDTIYFQAEMTQDVEQLEGMIWYLAAQLDDELAHKGPGTIQELIKEAQKNYEVGLDKMHSHE